MAKGTFTARRQCHRSSLNWNSSAPFSDSRPYATHETSPKAQTIANHLGGSFLCRAQNKFPQTVFAGQKMSSMEGDGNGALTSGIGNDAMSDGCGADTLVVAAENGLDTAGFVKGRDEIDLTFATFKSSLAFLIEFMDAWTRSPKEQINCTSELTSTTDIKLNTRVSLRPIQ